ncbi:MAG: lipopolysaccharide biosynthesis protein [Microcystaceae cyanobacterium]
MLQNLKSKLSNRFVQNVGWLGASQFINRLFRLGTTIVTARVFTPEDFGLIAIIATIHQFILTLAATGLQEKIAQAKAEKLDQITNTVYWLNWLLSITLFFVQCIAAVIISHFYNNPRLILPICFLGIIYSIRAFSVVQSGLAQRENRLEVFAISDAVGQMATNTLCIIMVLMGFGLWAWVIPQVILAPIWNIIINRSSPWKPGRFSLTEWQDVFHFGKNILGVSLLATVRENIDYLLVGKFFSVNELGDYYFAFNAGIGFSLNILNTLTFAIFPYLTSAQGDLPQLKKRYLSGLKTIALICIPVIVLQSALAPFYVPIIFGTQWARVIPLIIVICLSGLPRPFFNAASRLLWAVDRTDLDFKLNVIFSVILTTAIAIGVMQGTIMAVAWSVLIAHIVFLPLFTWWATYIVFSSKPIAEEI